MTGECALQTGSWTSDLLRCLNGSLFLHLSSFCHFYILSYSNFFTLFRLPSFKNGRTDRTPDISTTTPTNVNSTQNIGIVHTNRSHMMEILDSSFYSMSESSRCVFHYPPKQTQVQCRLLNVGAWPTNESRQRDRSRGSAHSVST